jgi:hypothetical protein
MPCGDRFLDTTPDLEVVGPIAFSPDGEVVYFA